MKHMTDIDREYIENKYHRQGEEFNSLNRFAHHGGEYDESTGLDDEEMLKALNGVYEETKELCHAEAKAKGFAFVLDNARINVSSNDYFFNVYNRNRPLDKTFISKWKDEVFNSMPDVQEIISDYTKSSTGRLILDTDHVVPYWIDIMELGFPGLLARSQEYRKKLSDERKLTKEEEAFFESIRIEYEAIIRLALRIRDYTLTHRCEKTGLIEKSLKNIAEGAPKNTFEALLLMYTYFICAECVDQYQVRSLGNGLDRTLYKFYKSDIENGVFTRDEIKKFLAYFMLQFSAMGNYWGQPFYLCGTDFDNETDISDLTIDILEVYEELGLYNPKIQVKTDYNTNPKIIRKVLELIRAGQTSFVFCCIPGMIKSLMSCYGVTEDEARNCDISGCNEMHIRGCEACMISGYPNMAKVIVYTLTNGFDTITGKQIGIKTGEVEDFKSFDDVYNAFMKQFKNIVDTMIQTASRYDKYVGEITPSIMLSATVQSALEKAVDAYAFGVKYPTSTLFLVSFATAVDSLLAIKELVFEERVTTLGELKQAILNNWEGYDELRLKALNAKHKYGNDDKLADSLAATLYKWYSIYLTGQKNGRGGVYKAGVPSTLHFLYYGDGTEATPDGRKMGEECSKNVAPVIGMERRGILPMIRSAMKLDPTLFSEAFVIDAMLHPSAVSGEDGLNALEGILMNYMKNDGISIQFNIFSPEMLIDAQKNPDKYKNLQVRVSGWNVLWNNMTKKEQDAYIIRSKSFA